jgi:hypothetical protein
VNRLVVDTYFLEREYHTASGAHNCLHIVILVHSKSRSVKLKRRVSMNIFRWLFTRIHSSYSCINSQLYICSNMKGYWGSLENRCTFYQSSINRCMNSSFCFDDLHTIYHLTCVHCFDSKWLSDS